MIPEQKHAWMWSAVVGYLLTETKELELILNSVWPYLESHQHCKVVRQAAFKLPSMGCVPAHPSYM